MELDLDTDDIKSFFADFVLPTIETKSAVEIEQ